MNDPGIQGVRLLPDELLEMLPQREPFRFVDEITGVDEQRITAHYTFRPTADFYRGHFPGNPITPGVILLEAMAQVGVVSLGLYLFALERGADKTRELVALFTDADVEFSGIVRPGNRVTTVAEKAFFRRGKVRARATMRLDDGTVVCSGTVSGMGVPR